MTLAPIEVATSQSTRRSRALLAAPFLHDFLLLHPGKPGALKIGHRRFRELQRAAGVGTTCPTWMVEAVRDAWTLEVTARPIEQVLQIRTPSPYGYGRASYELNLGCNYNCEVCYLGLKKFEGLSWPDRERLLHILADAGVLWLQLTGGEPLIDKLFPDVYTLADELGMMLSISSNGSRLSNPKILDLLTNRRPYRLTLSIYGATAEAYDSVTRRPGSFVKFSRGLSAAHEAGLPINLNVIVVKQNAHQVTQMTAMAERLGLPHHVFSNISPTIYGGPESLPAQSVEHLRGQIPCPDLPIKQADKRWADYVDDPMDLEWLRGDALLHTDYNPLNILIYDGGAHIVDWAWPTRGAAFIDPACLILRLIAAGHTPTQAETLVAQAPAWNHAPKRAIDYFRGRLRPVSVAEASPASREGFPAPAARPPAAVLCEPVYLPPATRFDADVTATGTTQLGDRVGPKR